MRYRATTTLLALIFIFFLPASTFAQLVGGTGKHTLEAATPEGQFIGLTYELKGKTVLCGIRVAKLVFEFRQDGIFIHELKPASNTVEYSHKKKDSKETVSGKTTFTDLDYSSGKINLRIANLPLSEPNQLYTAVLDSPFSGRLVAAKK